MEQPMIAILLATYNPPIDWLCELLDSLNAQTYPSLRLYVRDDASTKVSTAHLEELLRTHITEFPFVFHQNAKNLGSTATFEALVRDTADEPYVAFCDQDDVWLPEKMENTLRLLCESPLSPTAVCTNVRVIDGEGKLLADRMEEHRRRHVFLRGEGLASELIYRNFALGCTMVMERARVLSYLPFPSALVHDHYLLFRAALDGAIDVLTEPQMLYRVYGGNQTGVMAGVKTKSDYFVRRIEPFAKRLKVLCTYTELPALQKAGEWSRARVANFRREKGSFRALWRLRNVNSAWSLFELFALRFPPPLFRLAVGLVQKGYL